MSSSPPLSDITQLLEAYASGDAGAAESLVRVVYAELKVLASAALRRENRDHTWQPTDLVHEAYIRLLGGRQPAWTGRHHFFGVSARLMRQLLVEHARARQAQRRNGGVQIALHDVSDDMVGRSTLGTLDLLVLDDALERLGEIELRAVRVVELRYFAGLSLEEVAKVLGVSLATVKRDWTFARAYLRDALDEDAVSG